MRSLVKYILLNMRETWTLASELEKYASLLDEAAEHLVHGPSNTSNNENRRRPAIKLLGGGGGGGGGGSAVDQPSPLVLHWYLKILVIRFASKIPSS